MIGGLTFWGCPIRSLLRLAGGDLNALVGLAGLLAGIGIGAVFLRYGFDTGRTRPVHPISGLVLPAIAFALLVGLILSRDSLPGTRPALAASLGAGVIIGVLAQRSRFCIMSSFRNVFIMRDTLFVKGVAALVAVALLVNYALGNVSWGFVGQPLAHSRHLWNLVGMAVAGLSFTLAGGCPARQLIRNGEGDLNAAAFVLGMFSTGIAAHRLNLYPGADIVLPVVTVTGGPNPLGKGATVVAGVITLLIAAAGTVASRRRFSAGRLGSNKSDPRVTG
jgi:YedE family putative selenium metabolism protein